MRKFKIPLTFWVRNNTFIPPLRKAIDAFRDTLSQADYVKLGPIGIRNGADKCLGLRLFNP